MTHTAAARVPSNVTHPATEYPAGLIYQTHAQGKTDVWLDGVRIGYVLGGNRVYIAYDRISMVGKANTLNKAVLLLANCR